MKTIQLILTSLIGVLLLIPINSSADDIEIYSGLSGNANIPNVMIILDNASNSNASMSACTYWDTTVPTGTNQGNKSIDNYMCALDSIVHGMTLRSDGTALVNIGIATMAGVYFKLTPIDDNLYTGSYPVPGGTTNRNAIAKAIRALSTQSGSATQGAEFQETWAYYTGGNGGTTGRGLLSSVTYPGTNANTGCQKNYNIFLSGVANASHANTLNGEQTVLNAAVDNAVAAGRISSATGTQLKTQISGFTESPWAIEWARYMYSVDNITGSEGVQSITTYSIAAGAPVYPAAMDTMEQYIWGTAKYGGGKYFPATNYNAIYQNILKILNEIQAVNSVFASSSLPVSVNAQGTYLNQIYMGMFRPDPNGLPRWVGNLKQYKFGYDTNTRTLSLVGQDGNPAISGGTSGFIGANALSYWTSKNTATQPDSGGGFWRNAPSTAAVGYDSPDGEFVERGGTAQVSRLANLFNNYATAAGSSTNPRKMYTYCPSGTSCNATLSDSSNAFANANTGIIASMFGASNITVSSLVRTGTTAVVTTNTPHGYSIGDSVTISGANQTEYNVTQTLTAPPNSNPLPASSFIINNLPDSPTTPSAGAYTATLHNSLAQSVSTITRTSAATTSGSFAVNCTPNLNCETATVTTPAVHGYSPGNVVNITGASPSQYAGNQTITTVPSTTTFKYSIPVYPTAPAANSYTAVVFPYTNTLTNITKSGSTGTGTATAHGFWVGQAITITNAGGLCSGARTVASVPTTSTFTFGCTGSGSFTAGATASPSTTPVAITALTRSGTALAGTATASGLTAGLFANGGLVNIAVSSGAAPNETAYIASPATITCTTSPANTLGNPCTGTTFTYPIAITPTLSASGTMQVALPGAPVTIPATKITRSGTTATITGVANTYVNGSIVDIAVSGTAYSAESAYLSPAPGWTISCPVSCSTAFTFGPVAISPATTATGVIKAYSATAVPDKTSMIDWVRGKDNLCDEQASPDTGCPNQTTINIRPSLHGDVLHSRPSVLNYGGTIGVVVFYGANDGAYRAVNGNQVNPTGSTLPAPGSPLWSFTPSEFFGQITRLRDNSPMLKLPSTPAGISPAPRGKDYFVDGTTSAYQKLNSDGTTNKAYLYLTMRRGGTFIYALDVTSPTNPIFLWKVDKDSADFTELGQTWSQPKVTFVKGYTNPVLIFGAGYGPTDDNEPPGTIAMGRGIFIVDALDGHMVWHAQASCAGTVSPCQTVAGMVYGFPSDITLVDKSGNDGYTDRLYAVDTGGNVWRVDLEPTGGNTPAYWNVTKLAALGCNSGTCASGTTPRKFFYPADMVPTTTYDAVLIGSGDREHPLYTHLSYNVVNRFYMIKDSNIGNDGSSLATPRTEAVLTDITSSLAYDGSLSGYYVTFATGEKVVNAPLTVAGYTYFGTNIPATPSSNSCTTNLGTAKGYRIQPLTGTTSSVIYNGGGLPPSPVAGSVIINVNGTDTIMPFCIGCGGDPTCVGADCKTAIGGGKPPINIPTSRSRTYWYKESE